jgi:hypothetical protein
MTEAVYDGSLEGLFAILDRVRRGAPLPDQVRPVRAGYFPVESCGDDEEDPAQGDLFGTEEAGQTRPQEGSGGGAAKELFAVSVNARDSFVHGWMSEFPIAADLVRFAWKVIAAARAEGSGRPGGIGSPEARLAAERAAADRGDPAVAATAAAAFKVCREIDRLRGLLRFTPDNLGVYTAWCAPDHFVLPGLADHFFRRFGDTPWAIIDEKRRLALACPSDGEPRLIPARPVFAGAAGKAAGPGESPTPDAWTELWRNYHVSINNESRRNPALQRQFMPVRYWKYLNEV